MLFDASVFSISSSAIATADAGSSSQSFGSATVITAGGTQTVTSSASSETAGGSSAEASASAATDGSTATVSATSQAGNSDPVAGHPSVMDAPPQVFDLFPELATFRDTVVHSALALPITQAVVGNEASQRLEATANRDTLIGYGSADTFILGNHPVDDLTQADVIVDFRIAEGDRMGLIGIEFNALSLQPIDLDHNGILDSTLIQLGTGGEVLAIALNTVDHLGVTVLSATQFLPLQLDPQ